MLKHKVSNFSIIISDATRKVNVFVLPQASLSPEQICCDAATNRKRLLCAISLEQSCHICLNGLRLAAHHSLLTGAMLNLTTVMHVSLSTLEESRGMKKKVNSSLEVVLQGSSTMSAS